MSDTITYTEITIKYNLLIFLYMYVTIMCILIYANVTQRTVSVIKCPKLDNVSVKYELIINFYQKYYQILYFVDADCTFRGTSMTIDA